MNCPHCGAEINIGSLLGSVKSKAKASAARRNAKLGGWPKGRKRKVQQKHGAVKGTEKERGREKKQRKRPQDANALAHSVVADAERITQQGPPPQLLRALPSPRGTKGGR